MMSDTIPPDLEADIQAGDTPVKQDAKDAKSQKKPVKEHGGRDGLDPTRYNDWEINGKCVDF